MDYDEADKDWKVVSEKISDDLRCIIDGPYSVFWFDKGEYIEVMRARMIILVGSRMDYFGIFRNFFNGSRFNHFSGVGGFDRYLVTSRVLEEL